MVAMIGNGSAPGCLHTNLKPVACNISPDKDEEDFGDFEFKGESLLNLVQPELVSLSEHWLAALRDHALLSLPPGKNCLPFVMEYFASQSNSVLYNFLIAFFNPLKQAFKHSVL